MTEHDVQSRLVRGYLLETLSPSERVVVDRHLAESAEWREALAHERRMLDVLGSLPEEQAPLGLAKSTVAAVNEAAHAEAVKRTDRGLRLATLLLTLCVIAMLSTLLLPQAREASRRASDQNNLKQLGIVFKMYASDDPGEKYPPMAPYNDVWMFDLRAVYPEYLTDLAVLVNPNRPDAEELVKKLNALVSQTPTDWEAITRIAAQSYTYTGWGMLDVSELETLSNARRVNPQQLDDHLEWNGKYYYRLKEGVARFLVTDINGPAAGPDFLQKSIPVMFNCTTNAEGGNVLYLDGHVSFEGNLPNISLLIK
ncbi:MAG: DUF1559 domain-containing protein [Candidatus Hydrogenedentes bacterium]|nr:DUF1559 domain-containing protein [Candidatus Hydrogenedentota bacterium]